MMQSKLIVVFLVVVAAVTASPTKDQPQQSLLNLVDRVQTLETKVNTLTAARSGFLAQFSQYDVTDAQAPADSPFKFDQLVYNEGNDYDSTSGVYTAPYTGIYVISVKIFLAPKPELRPVFNLRRNGDILDRISFGLSATTEEQTASSSTTLSVRLTTGDRVWVESFQRRLYSLIGNFRTFFSAVLISVE